MQAWILDESPGAYRWGSIDLPELAADDVCDPCRRQRAQPHGSVGHPRRAEAAAASRAGLRRRRRGHGDRLGGHDGRRWRRSGRQSRCLAGGRHRGVGQRQPDGPGLHDLRRALLGWSRRHGDRPGAQRAQAAGDADVGGMRRVPAGLPHRLSHAATSPPAVRRHVAGRRHRLGRVVRRVGIGNDDGRPGRGRPAAARRSRRRHSRWAPPPHTTVLPQNGRSRPMSWSRASVRRHGSNRCVR